MNNYIVEGKINNDISSYKPLKNKKKVFIIFVVLLIIVIFALIIINSIKSKTSFTFYEDKMVNLAKEYVNNYGINSNKETYIDISKLNFDLPNNCSQLSGVLYNNKEYIPYLLCDNYESKVIENPSDFKLLGNDVVILLKGMNYYELGYVGDKKASISGNVLDSEGVYNIYYIPDSGNYVAIRKVIVIDNPSLINKYPVINLSNGQEIKIEKETEYKDNTIAIDIVDGDITSKIIKVSNLNEQIPGEYQLIYSVRNSLGYTTSVMQKVIVIDSNETNNEISAFITLSNENITNESITAYIRINGNNYSYTKLPNGNVTNEKDFEFLIDTNGKYDFVVVLDNGNEIKKTLTVTNIDKTIPKGTCEAIVYNNKTSVNVKVTSFNYIIGYNYYINNKGSGYLKTNSYNSNNSATNVYVIVKDYVGNEGKIVCSIEKKSSIDSNGIHTIIRDKPRLRIPISEALAKKGYTVNDLNMCIYNRVQEAGPYTRYGVVAAAYGLIDCTYTMTGYVLSYNHTSGKVSVEGNINYCQYNSDICGKLGINTRWGSAGGQCSKNECWHGLNCATFVRWAMCNGGMDLCSKGTAGSHSMVSTTYFPEADGVYIEGNKVSYFSGNNLTNYKADTLVRMIKPGDAIASSEGSGHAFVVVGRDNEGIYTAEDGYYMRKITYKTMLNGSVKYRILYLDNYYANSNNRNNLYK